jgi:hypothetical protein
MRTLTDAKKSTKLLFLLEFFLSLEEGKGVTGGHASKLLEARKCYH